MSLLQREQILFRYRDYPDCFGYLLVFFVEAFYFPVSVLRRKTNLLCNKVLTWIGVYIFCEAAQRFALPARGRV